MKILIIGSNYTWSIERIYKREFEALGHIVELVDVQNQFYDYYYKNLFNKLIYRLGISQILKKINRALLNHISNHDYDLIWVFKGMEIFPETLKTLKTNTDNLINYNPDNPFIFSGRGSGNLNITNSINLYDCHFAYNSEIKNVLEERYKVKTVLLPFACDVSQSLYKDCANVIEILKVCFLGNPDKTRASFIQQLADNGIEIDVYGNYWGKFINHKNITLHSPIYGIEQWKVLRKYRVQINMMRIHNLNSHNMRSFEIPGIGGIQLAPFTKDHNHFFEDGKEIFLFHKIEDCIKNINFLLQISSTEANKLRQASRNAITVKKNTYKDRSEQVISVLKSL